MKKRYLDLMETALSAYADAHILRYFNEVKEKGLTEHGFPRLTANIGILISRERRGDLLPLFLEMMDFCCQQIPRVKAANDFSVREILNCIQALENAEAVEQARIDTWKRELARIEPYTCYTKIAKTPDEQFFNWALFTAVSEYRRLAAGLGGDMEVVDVQLATRLRHLDENGMYRDGNHHAPAVYDHVPRGLFAILLNLGYNGKYRDVLDKTIQNAAFLSLKMQSATGEMPFGGRSNQFMNNEAWLALVFEYEAKRYAKAGDPMLAGKFKAAACRALDNIAFWFAKHPIHHVKNRFPLASKYGCEDYAYFDKYMITVASFLYEAYLVCDESVVPCKAEPEAVAWQTSAYFHALYLRAGGYSLQFDTAADPHYDACGLGRVHRVGAPSALCLSVPCPGSACCRYTLDRPDRIPLSLCVGVKEGEAWHFATETDTAYEVGAFSHTESSAQAELLCRFASEKTVKSHYTVDEKGVRIKNSGEGALAFALPAFVFDGERETHLLATAHTLEIRYEGWVCRYQTSGRILDLGKIAQNRNGHYRAFAAVGEDTLDVTIEIFQQG